MSDLYRAFFESNDVRTVRAMLPDVNGTARGKLIPAARFLASFDDGIHFARSVLVQDIEGENAPVPGFDLASGDADLLGRPDAATVTLAPWKEKTAQVILDAVDPATNTLLPQSCRTLLRRVTAWLDASRITARVASELEFYLFEPGHGTIGRGTPAYSLVSLARLGPVIDDLLRMTEAIGLEVEACLHEYAPGQVEINFAPSDPLSMADRTFCFRTMVKEVALAAGLEATFMAKPLGDQSGSGFHLHASLWSANGGEAANLFWDDSATSEVLGRFLAGSLRHAPDLFALFAPTVNAYRRYIPGEYVPTGATWGDDDRTNAIRIPAPGPKAARIEHRIAGADANPYLVIAAVLLAGLDGIEQAMPPPSPETKGRPGVPFPRSLPDALDRLEASPFAREALGAEFLDVFLAVKRQEWRKFQRVITPWELDVYGSAL